MGLAYRSFEVVEKVTSESMPVPWSVWVWSCFAWILLGLSAHASVSATESGGFRPAGGPTGGITPDSGPPSVLLALPACQWKKRARPLTSF